MSVATGLARSARKLHNALYRRFDKPFLRTIKGMPILLLTVKGRKSGTPFTTPVAYFTDGDGYVVCGSSGGTVEEPQWFRNLRQASAASIEVGERRRDVAVRVVGGEEHERLLAVLLKKCPSFIGYQDRIDRKGGSRRLPLAVLTPRR